MTRKIGDKLTDKNGVRVKIVESLSKKDVCDGCLYNDDCPSDELHPMAFGDNILFIGCESEKIIFVEDK